jgi:hypothetical protein
VSPDSQESRLAALKQQVADLADVVARFGPMLVDQVRQGERLEAALVRIRELEDDAEEDRKQRAKDRADRTKFALTFAVSVIGLLITFVGLVFVILTFAGGN